MKVATLVCHPQASISHQSRNPLANQSESTDSVSKEVETIKTYSGRVVMLIANKDKNKLDNIPNLKLSITFSTVYGV